MKRSISGYLKDDENHWVAKLICGHYQHVRHTPPWFNRPWVLTEQARTSMLGFQLNCKKCDNILPKDF
ncbi:MAG: DUF3565 domain-containing protein [Methylococcales bacterium]|nr:DUF3565 domain-containing protein [Methylococcales bacterium]MBT7410134.1 DUF3565 domain-containing protein [Methylococcales bacterium]